MSRERFIKTHQPCPPECGQSSDAYSVREDGSGYCFSCEKNFKESGAIFEPEYPSPEFEIDGEISYDFVSDPDRGIFKETYEKFGVQTKLVNGKPFARGYPYKNGAIQVRVLPKTFFWTGDATQENLFGEDVFDPGSKKAIVITEGAEDALAVYQMLRGDVAVVSVISAPVAVRNIQNRREYLNSFDKIVLCLDNDKRGQEATKAITRAGLFDYNKLFYIDLTKYKDANEYLQKGDAHEFVQAWIAAKRFTPDSIINSFDDIREALKTKDDAVIGEYPFLELSDRLNGLHHSEFILLKGLEGIGKTEVCRAIIYKLLKSTDHNIATIFLEEPPSYTIKGFATYELGFPCNIANAGISDEEIFQGYKEALGGNEERLYIHRHFATDDEEELIDNIRFLVTVAGCTVIVLDNLTMLTTGRIDEDERLKIDRIIRRLRDLVNELRFCLILVAHVNDQGQTRGSRLPDKLANTVIEMSRNVTSSFINESNRIDFLIHKGRGQGTKTGPAGSAYYDPVSYRLHDVTDAAIPEFPE